MVRLATENLQIAYGDQVIVHGLSVAIPDKKITAIIGANGCGKSTFLKGITRLIPRQDGKVLLDGIDIAEQKTKALARKMAILPQTQEAASGLTVAELVSYGRFHYQSGLGRLTATDYGTIDWALQVTNTAAFRNRQVDALSGGQRQRVWIAMALAQETEIIFLDEPTTYLDMAHQLEVMELLQKLNVEQERTIIMVLHDLNQAARFADYLIAMKDGEVIKTGTPEEVIQNQTLREVFRIDAEIGLDPRNGKPMCITYDLLKGDN